MKTRKTSEKDDLKKKKQRIDQALEDYWREPAHAWLRDEYQKIQKQYERCEAESKKLALYAAMAKEIPEDEFAKITKELWELAMEAGDAGYEFYKRVISNLEEIRRSKG